MLLIYPKLQETDHKFSDLNGNQMPNAYFILLFLLFSRVICAISQGTKL